MPHYGPIPRPHRQQGVALVTSLILLILVTLVALSGIGNVTLQQRITGHQQDRALGFQDTEAALRVAEELLNELTSHPAGLSQFEDCSSDLCGVVPGNTYSGGGAIWQDIPQADVPNRSVTGRTSQYAIQYMGEADLPTKAPQRGGRSASSTQYGGEGRDEAATSTYAHYRITARSHDPSAGEGSLVVLQTTFRVPQ
ncbi:MAG: PilX N-terminal domain-containing pilus assembly protein [Ectothiorhodospira sp.]